MASPRDATKAKEEAQARIKRRASFVLGIVILGLLVLVWTAPRSSRSRTTDDLASADATTAQQVQDADSDAPTEDPPVATQGTDDAEEQTQTPPPAEPAERNDQPAATPTSTHLDGLKVKIHPISPAETVAPLGGLDTPDSVHMQVQLTRTGAGITAIPFADIWTTAAANRQARLYWEAVERGEADPGTLPIEDRYVLAATTQVPLANGTVIDIPVLSARSITIGGTELDLIPAAHWKPGGPGVFTATILNADDDTVAEITRTWTLDGWDIVLDQRVVNRSTQPLEIRWTQYGPPNLLVDRNRYMDRRRFRFGFLLGPEEDPDRHAGVIADGSLMVEISDAADVEESSHLWPTPRTTEMGLELSWFASTNRYFALAIHPLLDDGNLDLEDVVSEITRYAAQFDEQPVVLTGLRWPATSAPPATLDPGATKSLSMGVYAGPLEPSILDTQEPYRALNMGGLVLYQMSSFCAICTFQWLAHLLLEILAFFDHWVVFDWGVAIILLVLCVRAILHPITRRSQMGMQKFGKQMQKLKPEMDKLRKRHGDDRKKMQEEQMALFREHGVNPLQMLGCLPMFLQMPIWVALYAALYFSFDLRQQPAFWGIFQDIGGWPFLADLASPDHFFWEFKEPFNFFLWNMTGINMLPFLMGLIFFFQQKYMTPATSMSPEQETQQKIMRVMMVVMFPLMLYSAPSGLTLYILTSSSIGILESRHIRKQVDAMDLDAPPARHEAAPRRKGGKDAQSRAYQKMLDRRQKQQNKGPEKRFKKRR